MYTLFMGFLKKKNVQAQFFLENCQENIKYVGKNLGPVIGHLLQKFHQKAYIFLYIWKV